MNGYIVIQLLCRVTEYQSSLLIIHLRLHHEVDCVHQLFQSEGRGKYRCGPHPRLLHSLAPKRLVTEEWDYSGGLLYSHNIHTNQLTICELTCIPRTV